MSSIVPRSLRRQECRRQLEDLIRSRNLWGSHLMGERELGLELGVSRTTVRRVLAELEREGIVKRRHGAKTFVADKPEVTSETRTLQIAVIAERHYEKNALWNFRAEMIHGLIAQCPRDSIEPSLFFMDNRDEKNKIYSAAEMRKYDGFISVGLDDHSILSSLVELNRGPVVLLDGYVRGLPVIVVVDNGFEAMRKTTQHILAQGHRRIAFIDCYNRAVNNPEKYAGYERALHEKKISVDPDLVAVPELDPELDTSAFSLGYDIHAFVAGAVKKLVSLPDPPTALIGFDDHRAVIAVEELERSGFHVGEDFCVAGCGDGAIRRNETSRLTSSRFYPRLMGRESVRAVKYPAGVNEGRMIMVKSRLFIRQSSCSLISESKGKNNE